MRTQIYIYGFIKTFLKIIYFCINLTYYRSKSIALKKGFQIRKIFKHWHINEPLLVQDAVEAWSVKLRDLCCCELKQRIMRISKASAATGRRDCREWYLLGRAGIISSRDLTSGCNYLCRYGLHLRRRILACTHTATRPLRFISYNYFNKYVYLFSCLHAFIAW